MASTIPAEPEIARPTIRSRAKRTATWMAASIVRAIARDAMPAVSKSSTTASGVTIPRGVVAIRWLRYRRPPRAAWPTPLVDVDRFITSHQASWLRLEQLTAAARGAGARLRPAEVDELVQLYQRASTHL